MANMEKVSFAKMMVALGVYAFLTAGGDCRPASIPGTITNAKVTSFRWFFDRIANPCEASAAMGSNSQQDSTSPSPTMITLAGRADQTMDFYHSMESALKETLGKLEALESADPSLPECNGISLDSLPVTPLLDKMNEGETIKQAYKTLIFLTTHFHLMSSDRQIPITGGNAIVSDQQSETPTWRFQRCGNETESFPSLLIDVTTSMENVLCTILTSATNEQTQTFREPLNTLQETVLYRYHTSCSTLQTRDCLVVREAKQALTLISRKYDQLMQQTSNNAGGSGVDQSENFDDVDNNI